MTELAEIRKDIADTKAELADAKKTGRSEAYLISLQNTLTEQQRKENLLLASQGEFQLLTLHIALSNPIPSTFMIHMMNHHT